MSQGLVADLSGGLKAPVIVLQFLRVMILATYVCFYLMITGIAQSVSSRQTRSRLNSELPPIQWTQKISEEYTDIEGRTWAKEIPVVYERVQAGSVGTAGKQQTRMQLLANSLLQRRYKILLKRPLVNIGSFLEFGTVLSRLAISNSERNMRVLEKPAFFYPLVDHETLWMQASQRLVLRPLLRS